MPSEIDVELQRWFDSADWPSVPEDLAYVAEAAKAFSLIRWIEPELSVRDFISEGDRQALKAVADLIRTRGDLPRVEDFLIRRPTGIHPESARIQLLLEILDELGFRYE